MIPPNPELNPLGQERTLKRNTSVLHEFAGTNDPNCLVLYHHLRDREFDAYNPSEYHAQMCHYYKNGFSVVEIVPRILKMGKGEEVACSLVCLRNEKSDGENSLCELAFQAQRQFLGISMLVKNRCFVCGKDGKRCGSCKVAFFCGPDCQRAGWEVHKVMCKKVKKAKKDVKVEGEGEGEEEVVTIDC
ncbi:hypothetical protein ScalyP_jg8108 [Parmales sp. scaly parma]|nr:hypothetical protein ScalyP_jg8108 [Parmales sp. scaly parma]